MSSVVNLLTSTNASSLTIVARADVQQGYPAKPRPFDASTAIIAIIGSRIRATLRPATRRATCRRTNPSRRLQGFPVYGEGT